MGKREETHFSVRVVHVELATAGAPFIKAPIPCPTPWTLTP